VPVRGPHRCCLRRYLSGLQRCAPRRSCRPRSRGPGTRSRSSRGLCRAPEGAPSALAHDRAQPAAVKLKATHALAPPATPNSLSGDLPQHGKDIAAHPGSGCGRARRVGYVSRTGLMLSAGPPELRPRRRMDAQPGAAEQRSGLSQGQRGEPGWRPSHHPSSRSRASVIPKWWPTSWTTVRRTCSTTSCSL